MTSLNFNQSAKKLTPHERIDFNADLIRTEAKRIGITTDELFSLIKYLRLSLNARNTTEFLVSFRSFTGNTIHQALISYYTDRRYDHPTTSARVNQFRRFLASAHEHETARSDLIDTNLNKELSSLKKETAQLLTNDLSELFNDDINPEDI